MKFDSQTLERLSLLDLRQYSGDLTAIGEEDRKLSNWLFELPVVVLATAQREVCEDPLYNICFGAQGEYSHFFNVRQRVMQELSRLANGPGWNLLSVLFDGIYVGDPEDLLYHRCGEQKRILHTTKGLGEKLAEVTFC